MVSRADRSAFAEWWWTVDKYMLGGLIALMVGGVVLSFAGSPAVAERIGYDSFHFVERHVFFLVPALAVMIAISFLPPRHVRRAAFIMLAIAIVLMMATLVIGYEVKGARRWINIAGLSLQSEAKRCARGMQEGGGNGKPRRIGQDACHADFRAMGIAMEEREETGKCHPPAG